MSDRTPQHTENDYLQGEERFRLLFEHSPDAIFVMDPHHPAIPWRVLACNDVACQMNGYTRDELLGRSIHVLDPGENLWIDDAPFLERLRREGAIHGVTPHRRKDGSIFHIEFSTSLVTIDGRELALGIDRDMTERLRVEAELQRAKDELERRVDERTAALAEANAQLSSELLQRERAERRLAAQYAIGRVLTEAASLEEAAPGILAIAGGGLQWDLGMLWSVNGAERKL